MTWVILLVLSWEASGWQFLTLTFTEKEKEMRMLEEFEIPVDIEDLNRWISKLESNVRDADKALERIEKLELDQESPDVRMMIHYIRMAKANSLYLLLSLKEAIMWEEVNSGVYQ
jgi:hypothetical protein